MKLLGIAIVLAGLAGPSWAGPKAPIRQAEHVDFCPCCRHACLKPWAIPDRWDDSSDLGHPDWMNNGVHDHEPFEDKNGNGLYDPGEPFTDQNGNRQYDEEYYHPLNTGYVAWKDAGLPIVLKPGSPSGTTVAGHYNAVDFTEESRLDATGNRYEWDIEHCNATAFGLGDALPFRPGDVKGPTVKGVRRLIAMDPDAYWDPATGQVVSQDPLTPRVFFLAFVDPRIDVPSGRKPSIICKLAAFFVEGIDDEGNVIGRFIRLASPGLPCPGDYPAAAAFISTCAP